MPNPTVPVLEIAFASALGIFTVAALIRRVRHLPASATPATDDAIWEMPPPLPQTSGSPYEISRLEPVSPELPPPLAGVPTWFYRKFDFVLVAFIIAFFAASSIGNAMADPSKLELGVTGLLVSIAFHLLLAAGTTGLLISRIRPIAWLGLRWPKWPWVFLIAPGTVVGMWIVFGGLQLVGYMKWIESLGVESMQETVKLLQTATDPTILILMAVAAVIVAPVCEEIVFRGFLYPIAKKYVGPWTAAICSGLIFAAAHGNLAALLPLFIFGVVLAVIYEKTGSIWATIAIHFCFNGATVALQTLARYLPHLQDQLK